MFHYDYKTQFTCAQLISLDLDDENKIHNVKFLGGCDGNLKAITSLVEGFTIEELEKKLEGIKCGRKPTSCSDQLVKAAKEAYAHAQAQ
ncbi:MAG: TIGR03905 family TSCPD domain-containing protein [Firmicutes bacterium]|nr:TIGR03905 family TSCPD domain-containing protein [Bacillota bacterium]